MQQDDRPDGPRSIGSTLRWLVYLARDPPLGSVVPGKESVVKTMPWQHVEAMPRNAGK